MTTEEKLKYFEESSLEEARKQASAMIEEYKVNLDKVEKEHKATTLRQSDLQLKTESDNLKLLFGKSHIVVSLQIVAFCF